MKRLISFLLVLNIFSFGLYSYAQMAIPKEEIPSDIPFGVRQEIEKLYSPEADERFEAVRNLQMLGPQASPAAPFFIQLFKDSDYRVASRATCVLGGLRDEKVEDLLISAMQNKDPKIRLGAVKAVVYALSVGMKNPKITPQLIALSQDEIPGIRREASFALGKTKDIKATKPLVEKLKDTDPRVRRKAITALGELKNADAVESLIAASKDKDPDIRSAAIVALGKIDDSRKIRPIVDALKDRNPGVRRVAIIVSGDISDPCAVEPLLEAFNDPKLKNKETWSRVIHALSKFQDRRVVDAFIKALNDNSIEERIPFNLIKVLGESKDTRAIGPLIRQMELISIKRDKNDFNTKTAINNITYSLKQIMHNDFGPDVEKWRKWWNQYQKDHQPNTAKGIVADCEKLKALAEKKDRSALPVIIESLKDKNSDIRESASRALAEMADKDMLSLLAEALKDEDYRVRVNAVRGLGKIKDRSSVLLLAEALSDPIDEVGREAFRVLIVFGKEAVPELINKLEEARLKEGPQRFILISRLLLVFEKIGDRSVVPNLKNFLDDKNPNVSISAVKVICVIGSVEDIYSLKERSKEEVKKIDKAKIEEIAQENREGLGSLVQMLGLARTTVVIALGMENAGEVMIDRWLEALSHENWKIRLTGIDCLSRRYDNYPERNQEIIEAFIAKLDDKSPEVRQSIIKALNSIRDTEYKTEQK